MTTGDLAAIKERAKASYSSDMLCCFSDVSYKARNKDNWLIADFCNLILSKEEEKANAIFFIHARKDILALVAEVERLQAEKGQAISTERQA